MSGRSRPARPSCSSRSRTCDTDPYEPNDNELQVSVLSDMTFSPSGADWLLALAGLQVCKPGPADWYSIDLDLGDALTGNIRFIDSNGDIDAPC